jgi:hypothetical protein
MRKANRTARESGIRDELNLRVEHEGVGKNCRVGTPSGQGQSSPVKPNQGKSRQIKAKRGVSTSHHTFLIDFCQSSRIRPQSHFAIRCANHSLLAGVGKFRAFFRCRTTKKTQPIHAGSMSKPGMTSMQKEGKNIQ